MKTNNNPLPNGLDQRYNDRWESHESDREHQIFMKDWDSDSFHAWVKQGTDAGQETMERLEANYKELVEKEEPVRFDHLGQKLPYTNIKDWFRANYGK